MNYLGNATNDDLATVNGTTANDVLSTTPLTANSANVFLDGTPMINPAIVGPANNNPGIAGGSFGPDLNLTALDQFDGLTFQTLASGGADQLVVNAPTENNGIGAPAASGWDGYPDDGGNNVTDIFPLGNSTVRGVGNAYDDIDVDDTRVIIDNTVTGLLLQTNFTATSFPKVPEHRKSSSTPVKKREPTYLVSRTT